MKKLWQNNIELDSQIEQFESGQNLSLDQKLVPYDVKVNLAQAKMLHKIGIINEVELNAAKTGLKKILKLNEKGKFLLEFGDEDVHTKVENFLTENYGEIGKKIHTGKSRNDQILADMLMYEKDKLLEIKKILKELANIFSQKEKEYNEIPMPGYTHMQKAMPTSVGVWCGSFGKSLTDDITIIESIYKIIDKSPLGSAAGFDVPLPLDKKYTAKILGFKKVQENPIYCQNSKGKYDLLILSTMLNIMMTLNKFATDVIVFTTTEFGFFDVKKELCTGSSIMPQKKNLDAAELIKGKTHTVLGNMVMAGSMVCNLMSGYSKDFQETKKPIMESFDEVAACLGITKLLINGLTPNVSKLKAAMTDEIFATHKTLQLVAQGTSFRDAYKFIKNNYEK